MKRMPHSLPLYAKEPQQREAQLPNPQVEPLVLQAPQRCPSGMDFFPNETHTRRNSKAILALGKAKSGSVTGIS